MPDNATQTATPTADANPPPSNVVPISNQGTPSAALQALLNQAIDPTALNQYMAQRTELGRQQQSLLAQGISARTAGIQQLRQAAANTPTLTRLQQIPAAPSAQLSDSINVFGSVGPWLAIFGSLLTRAPLTSAMNSAAAAMNGFRSGQTQAVQLNFEKWKAKTTAAIDNNNREIDEYNAARQKYGDKIDELKAELSAIAANNKDRMAMTLIDQGNLDAFWDLNQKRMDAATKILDAQSKIDKGMWGKPTAVKYKDDQGNIKYTVGQFNTVTHHWADQNGQPIVNIVDAGSSANPPMLSPEAQKNLGILWVATGQAPSFGMAASADRAAVYQAGTEWAKANGLSATDIAAGRGAYKASAASISNLQKQADAATSYMKTMEDNIRIVQSLMNKGAGTSAGPLVNRWLQAGKAATGDPDVKAFNTAITTVMDEYAKVLSGATGAQGATEGSRNQTNGMLAGWDSPQAISETINKVIIPDSNNRINEYQNQITAIRQRMSGLFNQPGNTLGGWKIEPVQ